MFRLENKVTIITGASSGIGRATAIFFSNLGSKLVLVGRNEDALNETINACQQELKNDIIKVVGDLTSIEFCKTIVSKTIEQFGRINILVNNAGILKLGGIRKMPITDFDIVMNVNVRSAINLTQLCLPYIISEKGNIVNVSSVAGSRSFPGVLAYCMSKAALDQFTKCTALELADKGVRVNSVNPGTINTEIFNRAGLNAEQLSQFYEHSKNFHALGRTGTVEEVARTIAFIASDNASFITGEVIHVDGGRHVMTAN